MGTGPLLQFPHPPRAGPVLLTLLSPPSSFILPSFAWFHIFFSSGQALLSALSWCSACTSVPEDVSLMDPWRGMSSTSSYSSAILFSCLQVVLDWVFISTNQLQDIWGRYKRGAPGPSSTLTVCETFSLGLSKCLEVFSFWKNTRIPQPDSHVKFGPNACSSRGGANQGLCVIHGMSVIDFSHFYI